MQYIDCKKYAQEILDAVKAIPYKKKLVILTVGDDPASLSYVKGKIKDCEYCGIPYEHIKLPNRESSKEELRYHITKNNLVDEVGGIIVQLPLPEGFDEEFYTNLISRDKDVDGFLLNSTFTPCTPEGIMYLLHKELGDLTGKRALVIGRGKLVGRPLAKMLLDADCTVTVAHSKTDDLIWELGNHNIIISAVGKPDIVDLGWCYRADVVIDVGVNRDANGKLVGDCCCFGEMHSTHLKVTPVPNGIGVMTRAMLMAHVARLEVS